jgi:hypothetical protein
MVMTLLARTRKFNQKMQQYKVAGIKNSSVLLLTNNDTACIDTLALPWI